MSEAKTSLETISQLDDLTTSLRNIATEEWTSTWVRTGLTDVADQLERGEFSAGLAADRVRKIMDVVYKSELDKSPSGLSKAERKQKVDDLSIIIYELNELHSSTSESTHNND